MRRDALPLKVNSRQPHLTVPDRLIGSPPLAVLPPTAPTDHISRNSCIYQHLQSKDFLAHGLK